MSSKFLRILCNSYDLVALIIALIGLGMLFGSIAKYLLVPSEMVRGYVSAGMERFPFEDLSPHGLHVNVGGVPRLERKDVILFLVLASGGTELSFRIDFCNVSTWCTSMVVENLEEGIRTPYSECVSGTVFRSPTFDFPALGTYLAVLNVSIPPNIDLFHCSARLSISFSESLRKPYVVLRLGMVAIFLLCVALAMHIYSMRRDRGWDLVGWVLGVSYAPVAVAMLSFLYVLLLDPFRSLAVMHRLFIVGDGNLVYDPLFLEAIYDAVFERFSPLSNELYVLVWSFVAMFLSVLPWSVSMEMKLESFEITTFLSRGRTFLCKTLMGLAIAVLTPTICTVLALTTTYVGLVARFWKPLVGVVVVTFLTLLILASLIQSIATFLTLVLRRGILAAMIVGVAVVLALHGYESWFSLIKLVHGIATVLGVIQGTLHPDEVRMLATLITVSIGFYAVSYAIHRIREVV